MSDTLSKQSSKAAPRQFSVDSLTVQVFPDAAAVAEQAALQAATHLQQTLSRQSNAAVILATGQSQLVFLEKLFSRSDIDWSRVQFFHMDEYLGLPGDHPASFRQYLRERVEQRVRAAAMNYLGGDALEPLAECRRYAQLLRAQPIDLCFLGIGENGHLAFNDPPVARFDDPDPVKLVKLDDICKMQQVKQGHFPGLEAVPPYAVTLTIPTLCSARKMLCLAQGTRKATIVKEMLHGPIETACPASILRKQAQATLLLDREAAGLLS